MAENTKDLQSRTPSGRVYVDPANFVRADQSVTFQQKATFSGEIEVDGALNHDGSTLGVLGAAPVSQQAHIADPSGGLTAARTPARAAINSILDLLEAYGLMAP